MSQYINEIFQQFGSNPDETDLVSTAYNVSREKKQYLLRLLSPEQIRVAI